MPLRLWGRFEPNRIIQYLGRVCNWIGLGAIAVFPDQLHRQMQSLFGGLVVTKWQRQHCLAETGTARRIFGVLLQRGRRVPKIGNRLRELDHDGSPIQVSGVFAESHYNFALSGSLC